MMLYTFANYVALFSKRAGLVSTSVRIFQRLSVCSNFCPYVSTSALRTLGVCLTPFFVVWSSLNWYVETTYDAVDI